MKIWSQGERLKAIKHTADKAKSLSARLVSRGLHEQALALTVEALVCIQSLSVYSNEELHENREQYARFLS